MKQITQVEIISAYYLDIFKWLRKEFNLSIIEAKELSNQKVIDFNGDYEKAIQFYNYLRNSTTNSARLIIDYSYDSRGAVGSYGYSVEQIEETIKYSNEYKNEK